MASNRRYRTADGEQREETMWFNVNAWGRQAEILQPVPDPGSQVYVEGTLTHTNVSLVMTDSHELPMMSALTEMQMLGSRGGGMDEERVTLWRRHGRGAWTTITAPAAWAGGRGMGGYGNQSDDIDDLPF